WLFQGVESRYKSMFQFKHFAIEQDRTPMKVGTDGVLLGAWVDIRSDERHILDIGTGTGVIALMMAQRNPDSIIDGVEIDQDSAYQASENVAASPWSERVTIHHSDIQSFSPSYKYDLIVTNPPYFVDSLLSPDGRRSVARHTTGLLFCELVEVVMRLLNTDGRFALILPTTESHLFDEEATGRLRLTRRCEVFSREGGPVKRVMSEYRLASSELMAECRFEDITIESGRPPQFTEEYRALTADFYLKF
ncbi:MAG: methyltransferase, partial [Rikenellaceae bacterium]